MEWQRRKAPTHNALPDPPKPKTHSTRIEQPRFLFHRKSHPKSPLPHTPLPLKHPKTPLSLPASKAEAAWKETVKVTSKQCWSARNPNQKSQKRLGNYRKSNSIAQIKPMESPAYNKRKLSLVESVNSLSPQGATSPLQNQLNVTTWLILLRKAFVEGEKKGKGGEVSVEALLDYINSLQQEGLESFNTIVEPFQKERQFSRAQLIAHLNNHLPKERTVSYSDVLQSLTHSSNSKDSVRPRHKTSSPEEMQEQGVETARFHEGSGEDPKKQRGKGKFQKQNRKVCLNDSGPACLVKGRGRSRGGQYSGESIGMLTLQGRSPRQVMESQMFESMQQWSAGVSGVNVSFNEGEGEPTAMFQQQVSSLEQILQKIRSIQSKQQQSHQTPLNSFLEQLINYRLSYWEGSYVAIVGVRRVGEEKEENGRFMGRILMSGSLREYVLGLWGLKVSQSPSIARAMLPLLHGQLRVVNLSGNGLEGMPLLPSNNRLELLNVSHNNIDDIDGALQHYPSLKELLCSYNSIPTLTWHSTNHPLQLIDISHNRISTPSQIVGLQLLPHLELLCLAQNPLVVHPSWRSQWHHPLNSCLVSVSQNIDNLTLYPRVRDIGLGGERQDSPIATTPVSTQFHTKQTTQQSSINNSSKKGMPGQPPKKNKIHKIKMIQGKVL